MRSDVQTPLNSLPALTGSRFPSRTSRMIFPTQCRDTPILPPEVAARPGLSSSSRWISWCLHVGAASVPVERLSRALR
jgi:hypothetical protein